MAGGGNNSGRGPRQRLTKSGVVRRYESAKERNVKGGLAAGDLLADVATVVPDEPWITWVQPRSAEEAGIGVATREDGTYEAVFEMRLATVSSDAVNRAAPGRSPEAQPRQLAHDRTLLAGMSSALVEMQSIAIIHRLGDTTGQGRRYEVLVRASSVSAELDLAIQSARALQDNLRTLLAVGFAEYGFQLLAKPAGATQTGARSQVCLVPAGVEPRTTKRTSVSYASDTRTMESLRLPLPIPEGPRYLTSVVPALNSLPFEVVVTIRLEGWRLPGKLNTDLATSVDLLGRLSVDEIAVTHEGGTQARLAPTDLVAIQEHLLNWLLNPRAVRMSVNLVAERPIPGALATIVGHDIYGGRPFALQPGMAPAHARDLSGLILVNDRPPSLFPEPAALDAQGYARHFSNARFDVPAEGTVIGDIPMPFGGQEVRLPDIDRALHCYVIGATGTGKSTLLRAMICQDLERGHGVGLLDPHGDLFRQVLALVPARRRKDVVLVDFTDTQHPVGLNLLEHTGPNADLQRGYIVQDLLGIFWRLFGGNADALGPMFEFYMRNALLLVMSDPSGTATLLDLPRVFADDLYREYLLTHCTDASVREFWYQIAEAAGGESRLSNIAPYIVSKLTPFTDNRLIRLIVGQSRCTVDFRAIMDSRKILLVNLSKGMLSERDSSFLGMLVTSRLFAAAMSRADVPPRERRSFYAYIDEFQNFATGTIVPILAEARKYGLSLTLAHQNMGQLPADLSQSVLANTASKIFMRVGVPDANALAEYVAPRFSASDLLALPDGHALARLQVRNTPMTPFLLRTRPQDVPDTANGGQEERVASLMAAARVRHARSADDVDAEVAFRRVSYLEAVPGLFRHLSRSLQARLDELGIESLGALLAVLPEHYEEFVGLASGGRSMWLLTMLRDLATLRAPSTCAPAG